MCNTSNSVSLSTNLLPKWRYREIGILFARLTLTIPYFLFYFNTTFLVCETLLHINQYQYYALRIEINHYFYSISEHKLGLNYFRNKIN